MSDQRGGDMETRSGTAPGPASTPASTPHIVVTVIPADNPEIPGRITVPDARPATTIGELRRRVQEAIPSRPVLQRLRLIHAGTLLLDESLTLERLVGSETLNEQGAVTIHLALRPLPGGAQPSQAAPQNPLVPNPSQQAPNTAEAQRPNQSPPIIPPQHRHVTRTVFTTNAAMPGPNVGAPPTNQAAAGQAGENPQAAARRMHEEIIRQQIQLSQGLLRNAMQAGVQIPGQVVQQAIPLQDFQRHLNQAHQARLAHIQAQAQAGAHPAQAHAQAHPPQIPQVHGNNGAQVPPGVHTISRGVGPSSSQPIGVHPTAQHQPRVIPGGFAMNYGAPNGGPSSQTSASTINGSSNFPPGTILTAQYPSIYLLSSPRGHEAILLPPPVMVPFEAGPGLMPGQFHQMGAQMMAAQMAPQVAPFSPVNLQPATGAAVNQQEGQAQQNQARAPREAQPRWQDIFAAAGPLLGPLWLFGRLTFFAVILTWRRTWLQTFMIYMCATLIFLYQTGLLAPVRPLAEAIWTPIREHIESLVRDLDADHQQQPQQPQQRPANGTGLNPQETANRLLRQRQDQGFLRRVERSLALFLASFVPGVGEAQVAAREAAERRRREVREQMEREQRERAQRAAEEAEQAKDSDQPEDESQKKDAAPVEEPIRIAPESSASGNDLKTAASEALNRRNVQPTVEDDTDTESDD